MQLLKQKVHTSKQLFASQMETFMSVQQLAVSLAMFSRVAIVTIDEPQSAEAAVSELNGCTMQGYTLYVEHIIRANGGSDSQASASIREPECSQDNKPQTSKTESSSTDRQVRIWGEKVMLLIKSVKRNQGSFCKEGYWHCIKESQGLWQFFLCMQNYSAITTTVDLLF